MSKSDIPRLRIDNHHTVYILGAGFSAPRGLPVIKDFMIALRDAHPWLEQQGRHLEAASVEAVLRYRLESAAAAYRVPIDLENIEELFSLSDTGRTKLSGHIRVAIAATLDFRLATKDAPTTSFETKDFHALPTVWHKYSTDRVKVQVPMYEFFAQAMLGTWSDPEATTAFVSFNYDCLLDDSLRQLGYVVDYGLRSDVIDGTEKGEGGSIRLLKLHGSVNWTRTKGRRPAFQVHDSYRRTGDPKEVPELVPPTWRKLYGKEMGPTWGLALAELERATRVVILGFSMPETDLHFKYLLASGLSRNVSLREIVFVNPAAKTVLERAGRIFGDLGRRPPVQVIEAGVSNFLGHGPSGINIATIGRRIPNHIEHLQHSAW